MLLAPGDRFAECEVRGVIARGGSSVVYRVDGPPGQVALKVLDVDAARTPHGLERFEHEFEIAKGLHHPNIVTMHARGEARGLHWLTMEYIDGVASTSLVPTARTEPDVAKSLAVLKRIAAGLDFAHAEGVLHCDVKPSNILVCLKNPDSTVLTDFGIARTTDDFRPHERDANFLASIPYAAPEVLQAQRLYPATDQYSLACTAVTFLTGKPPFPLSNKFAIIHAHRSTPPPALSARRWWIPADVDPIVAKALAKNPKSRYPSCAKFVELLGEALDGIGPRPPARRVLRRLRR